MSNIFIEKFDKNLLFNFLNKISNKFEDNYVINKASYKKSLINNEILNFYNSIEKYYNKSKKYYLTRPMNYNHFITIIRQIIKFLEIPYFYKKSFLNSKYEILYYIKYN